MTRTEYEEYLKSPHWRTLARLRREFDGDACAVCGSEGPLEVHHRTYERCPYRERLHDVVTLCAVCHAAVHAELKRRRGAGQEVRLRRTEPGLLRDGGEKDGE